MLCVCEGGGGGGEVLERKGILVMVLTTFTVTYTPRVTPPSPPHLASDDDIDGTLQNDIPAAPFVSLVEHCVEGRRNGFIS